MQNTGSPSVILAKTIKGYGMGKTGESVNTIHQQKKLDENKFDPNLYISTSIRWYITGNLETTIKNGVTLKSVTEKNLDQINIAARTIPNISTYLTNLSEYFSDTTYIVPKDINPIG